MQQISSKIKILPVTDRLQLCKTSTWQKPKLDFRRTWLFKSINKWKYMGKSLSAAFHHSISLNFLVQWHQIQANEAANSRISAHHAALLCSSKRHQHLLNVCPWLECCWSEKTTPCVMKVKGTASVLETVSGSCECFFCSTQQHFL